MKVCFVSGGSRGIGKAIAKEFARNGFSVVATYNNTYSSDDSINYVKCNVADSYEIQKVCSYISDNYGRIDVIVNNAGLSICGLVQDNTEEEFDRLFDINMKSVFSFTKGLVPLMIKQKSGCIINISSMWGMVGAANESLYSASKGAVISYTKSLAKELGPSGITVNAICPGVIKTDMLNFYTHADIEELKNNTPLQRLGRAEDVAALSYFLSTASYITGQAITIDGGFSL